MDVGSIIALIAVLLQVVSIVVIAVWVVGKIRTTTETLGVTIQALADNVNRLHNWLNEVDARGQDQDNRITALETEMKVKSRLFKNPPQNPSS